MSNPTSNAYFLLIANDAPDASERRLASRADHLARVERGKADGIIKMGGPLKNDAGEMTGSFMVFALPTRQAVEDWIGLDAYIAQHVWDNWTILPCGIAPLFL